MSGLLKYKHTEVLGSEFPRRNLWHSHVPACSPSPSVLLHQSGMQRGESRERVAVVVVSVMGAYLRFLSLPPFQLFPLAGFGSHLLLYLSIHKEG